MLSPHIIIIGGGFGGLRAAQKLGRAPVRVTLIDRRNHHLFQPLLYQVATAGLSPADIAVPIRSVLRRFKNIQVLMDEVVHVDTLEKRVSTRHRDLTYDYLIVAIGSQHSYFGHDEWQRFAPGLKTIEDATAIRSLILSAFEQAEVADSESARHELLTFVLVGAGPTGVEMAGAIIELSRRALARDFREIDPRSSRVLLIEAQERVLPAFPKGLATYADRTLRKMGVEVMCGAPVENVAPGRITAGGKTVEARTVIWCAGVETAPVRLGLPVDADDRGRAKVTSGLTIPGDGTVFVIGDAAVIARNGKSLPGLATVARQQGAFVAKVIARRAHGDESQHSFRYRDWGQLATIGRSAAIADLGRLKFHGRIAWVFWSVVHIYRLIGFRNRLLVFVEWMWAYVTFARGARLITGVESRSFDDQDS